MTTDIITTEFRDSWYAPRIDPPIPAHWPVTGEERGTLEDALWRLLSTGESDTARYEYYFWETPSLRDAYGSADWDGEVRAYIRQLIDSRRAYIAALGGVPGTPLNLSLAELERQGVKMNPDFGCCGIPHEAPQDGHTWYGYVSLGPEEAEELIKNGETRLSCGAFVTGEELEEMSDAEYNRINSAVIRQHILPVFERHGVEIDWDGTYIELPVLKNAEFSAAP